MRVVVALGGNALLRRGEPTDASTQRRNVETAARAVAALIQAGHEVVVTHGNGPQVGLLALQAAAYDATEPYPLDILDAETEGMIGYLLAQELMNRLRGREVVTILTQVVVDAGDPAFARPTKPIGPVYDEAAARRLAVERSWTVAADGQGLRRVVPSPKPRRIVELASIRLLVESGAVVVCAGGGGIPVIENATGDLSGVEAVIDKDRVAALLAEGLHADALLMLTDVDAVYQQWGSPGARPIARGGADELRSGRYAEGSMGPKVEAGCAFVTAAGGMAGIGRMEDAGAILDGRAGTTIVEDGPLVIRSAAPDAMASNSA